MFRTALALLTASGAVFIAASAHAQAEQELGTWLNADQKGKIALRECEDNTLCGNIVWLKDAVDEQGQPWRDRLNPESKLRARQVVGMNVLINAKKIGPNTWQGYIYDPEVGKIYYLKHLKLGQDKVEIKGCLKSGWPCRTKYWTRTQPIIPAAPSFQVAGQVAGQNSGPVNGQVNTVQPGPRTAPPQRQAARTALRRDITAALPGQTPYPEASGYLVQVAARQSRKEALRAFNDLQLRFPQMLGGMAPEVLRADLGQRGIWFRIGIGPMAQQSAAVDFCRQLKSQGGDCLIRRR
ncbi:MAG: DUF2147 domain-containing protein [Alphaproteobacteria bacterium]